MALGCHMIPSLDAALAMPFELAWIGEGCLERLGDEFAADLAERHAAALLFDVTSCEQVDHGTRHVIRDAGRGARDVIRITGPAALVVSPWVARPDYVSRFRRRQARTKLPALPQVAASHVTRGEPWQAVRPRTRHAVVGAQPAKTDDRMDAAFGIATPAGTRAREPILADPETCARHLARYLAHHGFLARSSIADHAGLSGANTETEPKLPGPERQPSAMGAPLLPVLSALARRPRGSRADIAGRLRQPRRLGTGGPPAVTVSAGARRPRPVSKAKCADRGPRRLQTDVPQP